MRVVLFFRMSVRTLNWLQTIQEDSHVVCTIQFYKNKGVFKFLMHWVVKVRTSFIFSKYIPKLLDFFLIKLFSINDILSYIVLLVKYNCSNRILFQTSWMQSINYGINCESFYLNIWRCCWLVLFHELIHH